MTFCILLFLIGLLVLFLVTLPIWAERLVGIVAERCREWICGCGWKICLAFGWGFVLGGLVFCCGETLLALFSNPCRVVVGLFAGLLLLALGRWICLMGCCGPRVPGWPLAGVTIRPPAVLTLFALVLLAAIWRCCGDALSFGFPGWTRCDVLIVALLALIGLTALLKYLSLRICKEEQGDVDCKQLPWRWAALAALLMLLLAALIVRCCERLGEPDFDLAMVGIWWEGEHAGEAGAHLRWGFRYGLPFPEDGFDIQRRDPGGSWVTLNTVRMHPVVEWGDPAAVTGDMSLAMATERLHPDLWADLEGAPFDELLTVTALPEYDVLYLVETPDPAVYPVAPLDWYTSDAARQAYVDAYFASGDDLPALVEWEIEPMTLLQATALYPQIARLLGWYWIDTTADPAIEYDYRVVGYWADQDRRYTLLDISEPGTAALSAPFITDTESPVQVADVGGVTVVDDQAVALGWTPPDLPPDQLTGPLDIIDSVVFEVEHKPEQGTGAPPLCPTTTPSADFAPAERTLEDGTVEVVPKITPTPVPDSLGVDVWPDHYFFHRHLEYGCHAYRVRGEDVFGRPSPWSGATVATVADITAPPPPILVTANLYQRDDATLDDVIRDRWFPEGSASTFALVVGWVWADEQARRSEDLAEFRATLHHTDHDTFVQTGNADVWGDPASWDLELGGPVAEADDLPMPARYADLGVAGRYYEIAFTDADYALSTLGLDAGDTLPVAYAWVGVSSVDRDPYANRGTVSAPVLVNAVDLVPPDAPDAPVLAGEPSEADAMGNSSLRMSWSADPLYTYALHRVDVSLLDVPDDIADIDDADLPTCLVSDRPTCDWLLDGPACAAEHDAFLVRAAAWIDARFARVSPLPIAEASGSALYDDTVDASISREFLYTATAFDAAGNQSAWSCPGDVILVPDGIAPRAPVLASLVGGDASVTVTWNVNTEADLERYTVYRTAVQDYTSSRRRMVVVAELGADGAALDGGTDATRTGSGTYATLAWVDPDVDAGTAYWYRVDAADLAANRSPLSGTASGRAYDAVAPDPPSWAVSPLVAGTGGTGDPEVTVRWALPAGDPDARVLVQRRRDGSPMWASRGGWTEAGATELVDDAGLDPGETYTYRLRAMDTTGNRSVWSSEESVAVP